MVEIRRENVWSYPRPPLLQPVPQRIRIVFDGREIVDTLSAWRVLETSHPPTYYLPRADILPDALAPAAGSSLCEWKGRAVYLDVGGATRRAGRAAWSYPRPDPAFAPIAGHVAFYAAAMDACFVGDEQARPQPGGFYGGWLTSWIEGPVKGEPGTEGW